MTESSMLFKDKDIDEALGMLMEECIDISPPLTMGEIVEIFKERINIEAFEMIKASLKRLQTRGTVVGEYKGYRIAEPV